MTVHAFIINIQKTFESFEFSFKCWVKSIFKMDDHSLIFIFPNVSIFDGWFWSFKNRTQE